MKKLLFFYCIVVVMHISVAHSLEVESSSKAQKDLIQATLGAERPISKITAIKSEHHKRAYYVGALFKADGRQNILGIWLVGGKKRNPTSVYSINDAAWQFSRMKKADETKYSANLEDEESQLLKSYFYGTEVR